MARALPSCLGSQPVTDGGCFFFFFFFLNHSPSLGLFVKLHSLVDNLNISSHLMFFQLQFSCVCLICGRHLLLILMLEVWKAVWKHIADR